MKSIKRGVFVFESIYFINLYVTTFILVIFMNFRVTDRKLKIKNLDKCQWYEVKLIYDFKISNLTSHVIPDNQFECRTFYRTLRSTKMSRSRILSSWIKQFCSLSIMFRLNRCFVKSKILKICTLIYEISGSIIA